jgi:GNAT superfamily N-acetyltransferase
MALAPNVGTTNVDEVISRTVHVIEGGGRRKYSAPAGIVGGLPAIEIFCHVIEIAVKGRHRSAGIGAQPPRAAEDWRRRKGAAFALLEFPVATIHAGEFYEHRMGYSVAAMTAIKALWRRRFTRIAAR